MSSKHIADLIKSSDNRELSRVFKRSEAIGRLTRQLSDALPTDMGAAIVAAAIDDAGILTVKAASSAWASRLRFETETLIDAAGASGQAVREVRIRVARSTQA